MGPQRMSQKEVGAAWGSVFGRESARARRYTSDFDLERAWIKLKMRVVISVAQETIIEQWLQCAVRHLPLSFFNLMC